MEPSVSYPALHGGESRAEPLESGGFNSAKALQNMAPQTPQLKVFKSIERPVMTPVYGTSVPPRGLSGQMRALAYRFSEGQLAHWMTLLAADRVDVIEGIIEDLKAGHVPNIFAEMGLKAELKYNRPALIRRALYGAGTVVIGLWLFRSAGLLGKVRKVI